MATSSTYCTHRDLEDIFPNVNDYDSKEPIYGWTTSANLHQSHNCGLVTVLFLNGDEITGTENTDEPNANGEWTF